MVNILFSPLYSGNFVEKVLKKPCLIFQYFFDSVILSELWESSCNFLLTVAREVDSCQSYKGKDWEDTSSNLETAVTILACVQLLPTISDSLKLETTSNNKAKVVPYNNDSRLKSPESFPHHFCFSVTINKTESGSNWMAFNAQSLADKAINSIILPGSHDAAAYELSNNFAPGEDCYDTIKVLENLGLEASMAPFIKPWLITQKQDIYQQLKAGARYLDLRVAFRPSHDDFYVVHGYYGHKLSLILRQIARFMRENPCEIIIIHLKNLNYIGDESEKTKNRCRLESMITQFLDIKKDLRLLNSEFSSDSHQGRMLIPTTDFKKLIGTLQEMWDQAKQIIFIYKENTSDPRFMSTKRIFDYWPNEDSPENLYKKLEDFIIHPIRLLNLYDHFHVLQTQLTPKIVNIALGMLFSEYYKDLKDMADDIKENYLHEWLQQWKHKSINIVIMDFIDEKNAKKIYDLNK